MEEVVATIFLRRLNSLLREEYKIFGGLEDQILLLITQLSHLNSHIESFKSKLVEIGYFRTKEDGATSNKISTELKESIHNWLVRFRETIHDADDCIDLFIIRMNSNSKDGLDDSDRIVIAALLGCELRIINECLVEILDAKSQLDTSIASLSIERSAIIDDEDKDKLVELLMAEGLIEEIPGERMEAIVEGNINKLIDRGMLRHQHEVFPNHLVCSVPNPDRHFVAAQDEYLYLFDTNTNTNIPLNIRHVRIIAKYSKIASFLKNIHISSIRSLLIPSSHLDSFQMKLYNLKLLRVLALASYECNIIIEEVGNLIHLRYLELRFGRLKKLPKSIGNLRKLQTLNIECPSLKELPSEILNLLQLRHLKIYNCEEQRSLGLIGIGRLTNLQTLSGLYVGDGIGNELSNLTQIRKLGIVQLTKKDACELYASIMKMTGLLSLSLSATCDDYHFNRKDELLPSLEPFSPPSLLQKLHLNGCLQEIPDWFSSMKNLTQLVLNYSNLLENPTSVLQSLPNLKFLELDYAYTARYIGREFCRFGGFPSLETLIIKSRSLIEWTELEEGSFPSLKFLYFSCPSLRTLPEGLQLITTLQKLNVHHWLHDDLARKLSPDGGPESYKIKHIPTIIMHDY